MHNNTSKISIIFEKTRIPFQLSSRENVLKTIKESEYIQRSLSVFIFKHLKDNINSVPELKLRCIQYPLSLKTHTMPLQKPIGIEKVGRNDTFSTDENDILRITVIWEQPKECKDAMLGLKEIY